MEQSKVFAIDPYFFNNQHPISISVVGVGGTGSLVLTKLARLNSALRHIDHSGISVSAYDYDIIEEFNIGRQMFTDTDVGDNKALNVISKINLAFNLNWLGYPIDYLRTEHMSNIIISCVDNHKTKTQIIKKFFKKNESLDYTKKYFFIDCGNGRDFGQVIFFDYEKKLKNTFDLFGKDMSKYDTVEAQGEGCSYLEKLEEQDLFINDFVSIYVLKILKEMFFNKYLTDTGYFFNTRENLLSTLKYE